MARSVDPPNTNPFEPPDRSVGDFFAPFFTVRFLSAEISQGNVVDAETGAEETLEITESGSVVASSGNTVVEFTEDENTQFFRSYVTNLTVTSEGNSVNFLELTMEPPFDDAIKIIDQRVIQFNSIVVAEWGWSSADGTERITSEKHYFTISQPPQLQMSNENVSITLTGIDLFGYSAMKRETYREYNRVKASKDGVVYDTDFKILESIAAKNKLRLNTTLAPQSIVTTQQGPFGPTVTSVRPTLLPIFLKKPNDTDKAESVEQYEKDWLFFRRVCDMNRLDFFTLGNVVYLADQNIARIRNYTYRFVFRNQPNGPRDIPMYSFNTSALPQLFFPGESKELRQKHTDEDAQATVTNVRDPSKMPDHEIVGERSAIGTSEADGRTINISDDVQIIPVAAFKEDETGKQISVPSGAPNRDEHTKRLAREGSLLAGQNADAEIPGVPGLTPMQLVRVEGVGKVFSGPYLVMKVTHKLSTDGYVCSVSLLREATTGDVEAGKGQRPVTGGNDPKRPTEVGQGDDPVDSERA